MDKLFGICVGQIGMSVHEFYLCYLHEILNIVTQFWKLEEQRQLAEWERTRMISFFAVKPHDSKKRIKSPSSLFALASDNKGRKTDEKELNKKIQKDLAIQNKRIERWKAKGLLNN